MSARQRLELPSHEFLAQLARDDPQAYEAFRGELLENFIDSAPARLQPRLHGIQFRVDSVRRLSRSALGSTVKIYELMWESFLCLNQGWQNTLRMKNEYENSQGSMSTAECDPGASARIIEFRPRPPHDQK